jgi:hypothetical protein
MFQSEIYHSECFSLPSLMISYKLNSDHLRKYSSLPLDNGFSFIRDLYKPYIHPMHALRFKGQGEKIYSVPQTPRFTKPLGKKLLILDVDTRPIDGPGELLNGTLLNVTGAPPSTIGRLSHYIFGGVFFPS